MKYMMSFRRRVYPILSLAVLVLFGCSPDTLDTNWQNAPAEPPAYDQSSEATQVAEAACRAALASAAKQPFDETRVDYVLRSEAGLGVWISLRGTKTQWVCQSDSAGNVAGLGEAPVH